jgi:hypothetical protein
LNTYQNKNIKTEINQSYLDLHPISDLLQDQPKNKKTKETHSVPVAYAKLRVSENEIKTIKVLLDSGSSETIISQKLVNKFRKIKSPPARWNTAAGILETKNKAKIHFSLPEFYEKKIIQWEAHMFKNNTRYDMIMGRDLLTELKMKIDFDELTIAWGEAVIPMKAIDNTRKDMFIQDPTSIQEETERIKRILDAKYQPADLNEIVENCSHLTKN